MKNKAAMVLIIILALGTVWWFFHRETPVINTATDTFEEPIERNLHERTEKAESRYEALRLQEMESIGEIKKSPQSDDSQKESSSLGHTNPEEEGSQALGYEVEDGVAVIEGDMVLGEAQPGIAYRGPSPSQSLQLWPGAIVPFFIQGDLPNPERVIKAMSFFTDSVTFRPYNGQADVLVFQAGTGNCKSYVGRVGGKQPLWIAPGCSPRHIAHEIMHALGFIHEQNRSDRDSYIVVQWQNVSEHAKINFELFPKELMKVSGLGAFDYESIMLYPPTMFSKDGSSETLKSRIEGKYIQPAATLSTGDLLRLERLSLEP